MSLLRKYASILIPLTVFLLASLFAWWIAGAGNCWSGGFHPDCWVRWDSALYMQIAEQGHTLFYCGPGQGYPEGAKDWCGNSGWAVLYPFLMFLVSKISGLDSYCFNFILLGIRKIEFLFVFTVNENELIMN
jgi:hypothetical protein